MATKRQPLSGLSERLQRKPAAPAAAPAEVMTDEHEAPRAPKRASQPDGRKGILVRARPEAWKALKIVALDEGLTLQDLMVQAINDVLTKHGKPPVA
ncbi:hypothetical protein P7D22_13345 [Lichenihabitans sp. Uapishka_5]|uniref:ribbon-helix-helix domain-containing protein n=1 Tax=Lichenihabitans sp. Uapishka_5 TaxID=3037302 RepID=UPI0029E7D536|nr:ribbon-helix-helix domain-containing protein [Lichenihabitans sp. Uapishka_5]MDX7952160.1 hypothetical protein [Lichenihabitans sp. Uapishka_5]